MATFTKMLACFLKYFSGHPKACNSLCMAFVSFRVVLGSLPGSRENHPGPHTRQVQGNPAESEAGQQGTDGEESSVGSLRERAGEVRPGQLISLFCRPRMCYKLQVLSDSDLNKKCNHGERIRSHIYGHLIQPGN